MAKLIRPCSRTRSWLISAFTLVSGGALVLSATPAGATPHDTVYVKIVRLHGGYTDAYLALETTGTFYNPESCPWAGLYAIPSTLPGRELFQSMAISAFMSNKEVSLTLDGCDNFPRVIAIRVQ